jgi:acyl homoserine lactone synthase
MKVVAIGTNRSRGEDRLVEEMHRLRAKVFSDRLHWDVSCTGGLERDEFDELDPTYILALSARHRVIGCARLLPATGTTMLQQVFAQLLAAGTLETHEAMIESSRFCVDTSSEEGRGADFLHRATRTMFAGIIEWGMAHRHRELVTATDLRFERILKRAGWPMRRLGVPQMINETKSVAGLLPLDEASLLKLRPADYCSSLRSIHQAA